MEPGMEALGRSSFIGNEAAIERIDIERSQSRIVHVHRVALGTAQRGTVTYRSPLDGHAVIVDPDMTDDSLGGGGRFRFG